MNHLSFTEFEPNSPTIKSAGLVSPEAMVLQGNHILYQLDATWNLVKFGFTDSRNCGDDQGVTFSNVSLSVFIVTYFVFGSPLTWQLLSLCCNL